MSATLRFQFIPSITRATRALSLAALLAAGGLSFAGAAEDEAALAAVLRDAAASDNAKVTAAQKLSYAGSEAAIAPLLELLASNKAVLRDAARYGLENIPSPKVEAALLAALDTAAGDARIGIAQSLGNIGSAKAVPALVKIFNTTGAAIAAGNAPAADRALNVAAANALGKIATPAALAALKPVASKCPVAALALLRGADRVAAKNPAGAAPLYRDLLAALDKCPAGAAPAAAGDAAAGEKKPCPAATTFCTVKQGALRGAILTGGEDGLALWKKSVAGKCDAAAKVALRAVIEFPKCPDITGALAGALATLPPCRQTKLAELLGARGDKAALPALRAVAALPASEANDPARFAAARALIALGDTATGAATLHALIGSAATATRELPLRDLAANALLGLSYESPAAEAAAGFKSMFNGKDLSEWRNNTGYWDVRNGILTAESTAEKPCKKNSHLIWNGGVKGDFELRAQFRLSKSANSGIQFRAEDKDADTSYQADMNGGGDYIGFLYHPGFHLVGERGAKVVLGPEVKTREQRRGAITRYPNAKAISQHAFNATQWNEYRIVAKGREFTLYVNGVKTNEFVDLRPNAPKDGVITLQMHAGPAMKIEYQNLRIRDL